MDDPWEKIFLGGLAAVILILVVWCGTRPSEEELRRATEPPETTSPRVDSGTLNNIGVETSRLDDGSGTGSPSEDTASADAATAEGVVRAAGASSY